MWLGTWTKGASAAVTNAERVARGAPVSRHHPEEEIGRAGLIALQDGLGQQVEGFVATDLVTSQKHRCSPWRSFAAGPSLACPRPASVARPLPFVKPPGRRPEVQDRRQLCRCRSQWPSVSFPFLLHARVDASCAGMTPRTRECCALTPRFPEAAGWHRGCSLPRQHGSHPQRGQPHRHPHRVLTARATTGDGS